ncbi:MAG: hypothetical protein PWQ82_1713 [Thermosediminibacterales bacterium]|nr:hypothetical protein [Thermosediminibacterales bacterium]
MSGGEGSRIPVEIRIKNRKNNFWLVRFIWEALGNNLNELYNMEVSISKSSNEDVIFKPFSKHIFYEVRESGYIPKHLPDKYNKIIGIDKRYFEGEKAFDPGFEIDGKNYHEKCDEYWDIDNKIKGIDNDGGDIENLKEKRKETEKELLRFAEKLIDMLNDPNNFQDKDLLKLIIFLKYNGELNIDDYKVKNLTEKLQKLKLEDLLKTNIRTLEEYKKVLPLQYNLVNTALILLKTDKNELNNCSKILSAVAKQKKT